MADRVLSLLDLAGAEKAAKRRRAKQEILQHALLSLNDLARMGMKQHPSAPGITDGSSSSSVARTLAAVCSPRAHALAIQSRAAPDA